MTPIRHSARLTPRLLACPVVLCLLLWGSPALAESVRLRPEADTTLFEAAPTNNLGRVVSLAAGATARAARSRALLRFHVAGAIPSNAIIVDAKLALRVVRAPSGGGGVDSRFQLHRVLRGWTEGSKSAGALGSPASPGEPTWLSRAHGSSPWSSPGAAAPADFVAESSASTLVGSSGWHEFPGLAADVQLWLSNPAANFGWILISDEEGVPATARRFGAREDTNSAPELVVQFSLPTPPPPRISGVQRIGNTVGFQFEAQPNLTYTVEHRASTQAGAWSTLTNVGPDAALRTVRVSDVIGSSNRFYRILAR